MIMWVHSINHTAAAAVSGWLQSFQRFLQKADFPRVDIPLSHWSIQSKVLSMQSKVLSVKIKLPDIFKKS